MSPLLPGPKLMSLEVQKDTGPHSQDVQRIAFSVWLGFFPFAFLLCFILWTNPAVQGNLALLMSQSWHCSGDYMVYFLSLLRLFFSFLPACLPYFRSFLHSLPPLLTSFPLFLLFIYGIKPRDTYIHTRARHNS